MRRRTAMPNRGTRALAVTLGLQLAVASVCAAEQSGASGATTRSPFYVQIGPVVTIHTEGEQYHRADPPLAGTTFGAAAAIGAHVAPVLAFEAELVVDGKLSDPQTDSYTYLTEYTAESRDILLGLNLRFRPPGRSRLEFAAGGGVAFTRFARRDIMSTNLFGPPGVTRGSDSETSTKQPSLSGSIAMAIPVSQRLELVPAIGARWIRRPFDTEAWYLGVGRYTFFFTAALRVRP